MSTLEEAFTYFYEKIMRDLGVDSDFVGSASVSDADSDDAAGNVLDQPYAAFLDITKEDLT